MCTFWDKVIILCYGANFFNTTYLFLTFPVFVFYTSISIFLLLLQFRQEYRLERKVLNELSIDPERFPSVDVEELTNLVATSSSPLGNCRHSISRVVVLHNDRLETFFDTPYPSATDDVAETVPVNVDQPSSAEEESSYFFDNDSFWSGSLTWY